MNTFVDETIVIAPTPPANDVDDGLVEVDDGLAREQRRSRRKRAVRAKTISSNRTTKAELIQLRTKADIDEEALGEIERPWTRGACEEAPRPCPFVSCQHHLYLDVSPETGAVKFNFPDLEVWELKETCTLDIADRGGVTLEETAEFMNVTRERIRQVEVTALGKLVSNRDIEKLRTHVDNLAEDEGREDDKMGALKEETAVAVEQLYKFLVTYGPTARRDITLDVGPIALDAAMEILVRNKRAEKTGWAKSARWQAKGYTSRSTPAPSIPKMTAPARPKLMAVPSAPKPKPVPETPRDLAIETASRAIVPVTPSEPQSVAAIVMASSPTGLSVVEHLRAARNALLAEAAKIDAVLAGLQ